MTRGSDALGSSYAKLDWATRRHEQMARTFEDLIYRREGGSPFGVQFELKERPAGMVIARFTSSARCPTR